RLIGGNARLDGAGSDVQPVRLFSQSGFSREDAVPETPFETDTPVVPFTFPLPSLAQLGVTVRAVPGYTDPHLPQAGHMFIARAIDVAGNVGDPVFTIIDVTADGLPVVFLDQPDPFSAFTERTPIGVTVDATDDVQVEAVELLVDGVTQHSV